MLSDTLCEMDKQFEPFFSKLDSQNPDEGVGEISVQIDLFTHPGTGEHKVTVKGIQFIHHLVQCTIVRYAMLLTNVSI